VSDPEAVFLALGIIRKLALFVALGMTIGVQQRIIDSTEQPLVRFAGWSVSGVNTLVDFGPRSAHPAVSQETAENFSVRAFADPVVKANQVDRRIGEP
jgi:hypothetical protein